MSLFVALVLLVAIGVALALIPMDAQIKRIIIVVVSIVAAVILVIWLLQVTGVGTGPILRIGR
jgi:ABC-type transport system involved in cytochrome c biogenesis permease subunit